MQRSTLAKRACLLLALTIIVFYFYGLGHLPLLGPDEPRYTQVAREMLLRRDLVTPTLGGHTWFEKPPLLYWMIMASFSLFGSSEWAARLGPAFSGLLTVAAVYWLAKQVEEAGPDEQLYGFGCVSALVTASSAGILVFARAASFDIVVTMTLTWSLSCFLASQLDSNKNRRKLLIAGFYIFVGLSLLAKGLIGIVIPFGIVGSYYLLRRESPRRFLNTIFWGLPLAVATAAIWFGPVIARNGSTFMNQFFIQHHFARYLTNRYHHKEPTYFYVLVLIPLALPWSAVLVESIFSDRNWRSNAEAPEKKLRVFAFAWLMLPLVFFSLAQSKLPGYIVPVLPAAALLVASRLTRINGASNRGKWLARATGGLLLVVVIIGIIFASRSGLVSLQCMLIVVAPLAVVALFVIYWARMTSRSVIVIVCGVLLSSVIILTCGLTRVGQRESIRDLIELANFEGYSKAPIYALHKIERSAEFYAAGRVVYGPDGEPLRFEGAGEVLTVARNAYGPILVIVPLEYIDQLTGLKSARISVIGDNGALALVAVNSK